MIDDLKLPAKALLPAVSASAETQAEHEDWINFLIKVLTSNISNRLAPDLRELGFPAGGSDDQNDRPKAGSSDE